MLQYIESNICLAV